VTDKILGLANNCLFGFDLLKRTITWLRPHVQICNSAGADQ